MTAVLTVASNQCLQQCESPWGRDQGAVLAWAKGVHIPQFMSLGEVPQKVPDSQGHDLPAHQDRTEAVGKPRTLDDMYISDFCLQYPLSWS